MINGKVPRELKNFLLNVIFKSTFPGTERSFTVILLLTTIPQGGGDWGLCPRLIKFWDFNLGNATLLTKFKYVTVN